MRIRKANNLGDPAKPGPWCRDPLPLVTPGGWRAQFLPPAFGPTFPFMRTPAGAVLAAAVFGAALPASAQQALQNSMANDAAAKSRSLQMQNQDYTFKQGDFRMLVAPSLDFEWNDNVFLTQANPQDDFILKPAVRLTTSYPLTQENLLYLDVSIGYSKYFNHSELDTLDLNSGSGSGFSFDIGVKDVSLNVHDRFNYTQDSAQSAAIANTGSYGTFQNAAGLLATWDLNDVTLTLGYDHQTVLATSSQFNEDNQSSELLSARLGLRVHPRITTGLEATASFTRYDQMMLNNNSSYSIGAYADIRPDESISIQPRAGYTLYDFQQSSTNIQTASLSSWYADLNISHDITKTISYSLDAGHEVQLGIQSDVTEDWYVRPAINWNVIKGWGIRTAFFYQNGTQGQGSTYGPFRLNYSQNFEWYGGSLSLSHPLTKRLDLALNYRLTLQSATSSESFASLTGNLPGSHYAQNLVELTLTYHPPRIP